jgi:hypothetical protein
LHDHHGAPEFADPRSGAGPHGIDRGMQQRQRRSCEQAGGDHHDHLIDIETGDVIEFS